MDTLVGALRRALASIGVDPDDLEIPLEVPARPEHGDWSTGLALQVAKQVGEKPRDLATRLVAAIERDPPPHLDRVEIAGPGFLNFFLAPSWLHEVLRHVVAAGPAYGSGTTLAGMRINLEFVSANPTGPLHAGGGRWVAVGDALANLLASQGAEVHREYYLNDAGSQLGTFGVSLLARYRGESPPEDGYQGEYLVEMALRMRAEIGDEVSLEQAQE
jgi:arginyl-tRNA synthetase